jgi:hypothetical protein
MPMAGSVAASPMIGGADPYAYDDDAYRRRRRKERRHSSIAQSQPPTIINVGGGAGPQPFPGQFSGMPGSTISNTVPLSSSPYQTGAATYSQPAYGAGSAIGVGTYNPGAAVPINAYSSSLGGLGVGGGLGASSMVGGAPLGGGILNPMPASLQPAYQASMAATYPSALPNIGGIVPGQGLGNAIVIPPPRSRHRSRERSRERSERHREREHERRKRRYSDAAAYANYAPSTGYVPPPTSAYGERY